MGIIFIISTTNVIYNACADDKKQTPETRHTLFIKRNKKTVSLTSLIFNCLKKIIFGYLNQTNYHLFYLKQNFNLDANWKTMYNLCFYLQHYIYQQPTYKHDFYDNTVTVGYFPNEVHL